MADDMKTSESTDVALIEQVGVGRIADALAISKAAVRKWRKTGIPEYRRQAILALVDTEQATAEQLSLVDVDTSTPKSNDGYRHIESVSEAETSEKIDEAQAIEGCRRPRQRENARPSFSAFQTQRQPPRWAIIPELSRQVPQQSRA